MSYTTVPKLLKAMQLAKASPDVECIRADWCTVWTGNEFREWFRRCLHEKINTRGGIPTAGWQRFEDLLHDARIINDYYGRRIVYPGHGILRDVRLKRRYPHVNCNPPEW